MVVSPKLFSSRTCKWKELGCSYRLQSEARHFTADLGLMLREVSPPADKLGSGVSGLNARARIICPRGSAERGEKRCIESIRLEVILHQQRLGHRIHTESDAVLEIIYRRYSAYSEWEGTRHAKSGHPTGSYVAPTRAAQTGKRNIS